MLKHKDICRKNYLQRESNKNRKRKMELQVAIIAVITIIFISTTQAKMYYQNSLRLMGNYRYSI